MKIDKTIINAVIGAIVATITAIVIIPKIIGPKTRTGN